jgi:hypothetical protein
LNLGIWVINQRVVLLVAVILATGIAAASAVSSLIRFVILRPSYSMGASAIQ